MRSISVLVFALAAAGISPAHADEKLLTVVPLPIFFYQPETSFGCGAACLVSYSPADTKPQVFQAGGMYTVKDQLALFASGECYLANDDLRLTGAATYSRFPTLYFGIGPDADLRESCTPVATRAEAAAGWQLFPALYVGPIYRFAATRLDSVQPGGEPAFSGVPGSEPTVSSGGGLLLLLDSRDRTMYPTSGWLATAEADLFPAALGSTRDWRRMTLDCRYYAGLAGDHVLAFEGVVAASAGDVPFQEMPAAGGASLLRGYYEGRFRDRALLAFQAEYRFPIVWRLGGALFGGVAQVAPAMAEMNFEGVKTAGGIGLRFRVLPKEHVNLRADFGFSPEGTQFYLSIGEAY